MSQKLILKAYYILKYKKWSRYMFETYNTLLQKKMKIVFAASKPDRWAVLKTKKRLRDA